MVVKLNVWWNITLMLDEILSEFWIKYDHEVDVGWNMKWMFDEIWS